MQVHLRSIREEDLENIIRWRTDPEITRFLNTNPHLTLAGQKEWLKTIRTDLSRRYWLIEAGGEGAGVIQLIDINRKDNCTSWGYYIGERRLRSIALALSLEMSLYDYVFDVLGFTEVRNETFSLNEGVIKLHQLCGCEITSVCAGEVEKEGVRYDITHMTMTRARWYALRESKKYRKIDFDISMTPHHVGYAVASIDDARSAFRKTGWRDIRLPLSENADENGIIADEGRGVYLSFMEHPDTKDLAELVAPMRENSPVSGLLSSRSNVATPYHLCYEVHDLEEAVTELKRRGYTLTDAIKPAPAFGGRRVAFLLHRDAGLTELLERESC